MPIRLWPLDVMLWGLINDLCVDDSPMDGSVANTVKPGMTALAVVFGIC